MDLNARENTRRVATSSVTHTKSNRKRKRVSIPRRTRKFQLRLNSPQDMHVAQILDFARSERREVTMIRDAVQLQHSLERGDLSILLERFPWIVEALKPQTPSGAGGMDELKGMLEIVIANQKPTLNAQPAASQPQSAGLKAAGSPAFAMPVFDDDDELPTLKLTKNVSFSGVTNFLGAFSEI